MNHQHRIAGLLVSLLPLAAAAVGAQETCVLVQQGKPTAVIVLAEEPTRVAQMAAAELAHYVKKLTGSPLAIVRENALAEEQAVGYLVLVGESRRTRQFGLTNAALQRQEHIIRNVGRWLVLMGHDEQELGPVDYTKDEPWKGCRLDFPHRVHFKAWGSMYAVDTFLERVCGVRWYLPGEIGEVAPKTDTITARGLNLRLKPWAKSRLHTRPWSCDPFDFYVPGREPKKMIPRRDMLLWWLRMKIGGDPWQVNHSVYSYYDRFAKEHPDWFADGQPKPRTHLCYTHPGFLAQHAQDARDYFDGKFPDMTFPKGGRVIAAGDYYPAVPIDSSAGWCSCPRCKALLDITQPMRDGVPGAGFFNGRYSEYVWTFVNNVAREVRKTHPDKWISAIAYARYFLPPRNVKLEPNISVCVTKQVQLYCNPAAKEYFNNALREWHKRAGELFIWEYYLNQYFNAYMAFPWIAPHLIGEDLEFLKTVGVVGQFVELSGWKSRWANPAEDLLPVYVTFKLLADDSRGVDEILAEHYRLFYGPAEEPMRAFFERIEQAWLQRGRDSTNMRGQRWSWEVLCPPEELKGYHSLMSEALALADEEPYGTRVRLMNEAVYKPMEKHCLAYAERSKARRRLNCPTVDVAPTLDGLLTEEVWKAAARTEPFVGLTMEAIEVETTALVARDDERLYVAFECPEPAMARLVADHNAPDKLEVCLDDDVEIFLDVGRTREKYYHLLVNPNGVFADRGVNMGLDDMGVGWNSGAEVKTHRGETGWTVEMAIPFAGLEASPKTGDVWGFNVCRGRRAGRPATEPQNTCWSPTFGGFNNPDEFGTLVMSDARPSAVPTNGAPVPIVAIDFEDETFVDGARLSAGKGISVAGDTLAATVTLKRTREGKPWDSSARVEGKSGSACAFHRSAQRHIETRFPKEFGLASDDFTVMLWFRTSSAEKQVLLSSTTTAPLWILSFDAINEKRYLRFLFATQPPTLALAEKAPPPDGTWHHVVVTVDRGSRATLYLDGKQKRSLEISRHKGALKNLVNIGGPYHYFDGVIDTVQIYQGALDPTQVESLHKAQARR